MKTQDRDGMKGLSELGQRIVAFAIGFLIGKLVGHEIGRALGWW